MPRRIDEIELVLLAVPGTVAQGDALGLDGNPPLPLQIHGIEHLGLHFPVRQPPTMLDKTVRQGGLSVIDVGDDGEVANEAEVSHVVGSGSSGALPRPKKRGILTHRGFGCIFASRPARIITALPGARGSRGTGASLVG